MRHFVKLDCRVETDALLVALQMQPELWSAHEGRRNYEQSPHRETSDIWLRYNDISKLGDDYVAWTAQHDSTWLPAAARLPQLRPIVFPLMARCEAVRLGGMLITRIPPGKRVYPHIDKGWHPDYYNLKLYVPLAANEHCVNRVEDEAVVMRVGECWYFDNTREHEVINNGATERISLIICLRVDK